MSNNLVIKNYLKEYIKYENNLEYAVLLKGKWGSGKTFFIKNFEELKEIKFVYVSLFGLKTIEEVHEKIFESFHPLLSSKGTKFLSSILKGAIKFGTKVEIEDLISLDKDLEKELNKYINIEIEENNLIRNIFNYAPKILRKDNKKNIVFVFDDLERCLIKTEHLFSLISDFVEQKGLKLIVIGNEEEIKKQEYDKFKEKIIGKEFEIYLNFEEAFFDFLNLLKDKDVKNFLQDKCQIIKNISDSLDIKNLRILKQSFIEFEIFIKEINKQYLENKEFVEHLIYNFFAFVMLYKKTNSLEEFEKLNSLFLEDKKNQSIFHTKLNLSLFNVLFGYEFWKNYLKKGLIDIDLNEKIQQLAYFKYETQPAWVKLCYYWKLEEEEFDKLLESVKNQYFDCDNIFENFYVLLHVISLLIFFQKKELIELDIEEIENRLNECIKKFEKTDSWKIKQEILDFYNPTGLRYLAENDEDFIRMKNFLIKEIEKIEKKHKLKQKREDITKFLDYLESYDEENISQLIKQYEHKTFFDKFEKEQINRIVSLPAKSLFILNNVINNRFSDNYIYNGQNRYCLYIKEVNFLENLKYLLGNKENKISKLKKLSVKYLLTNIEEVFKKLKNCKKGAF